MAVIKALQIEDCRFRVPDFALDKEFLTDFSLLEVEQIGRAAHFQVTDPTAWCYSVEGGPQHFLGFALGATSQDDLRTLSAPLARSQLFKYWPDPLSYAHEHWADSCGLNATTPTNVWPVREGFAEQYGDAPTDLFKTAAWS